MVKVRKVVISVPVGTEVASALKAAAAQELISISAFARRALRAEINRVLGESV